MRQFDFEKCCFGYRRVYARKVRKTISGGGLILFVIIHSRMPLIFFVAALKTFFNAAVIENIKKRVPLDNTVKMEMERIRSD